MFRCLCLGDKPLARLTKEKREKAQINRIINVRGEITTDTAEIKRIIRNYYEQLYGNKFNNLQEMDKFLQLYNHPKLDKEEIEHLNRPITSNVNKDDFTKVQISYTLI